MLIFLCLIFYLNHLELMTMIETASLGKTYCRITDKLILSQIELENSFSRFYDKLLTKRAMSVAKTICTSLITFAISGVLTLLTSQFNQLFGLTQDKIREAFCYITIISGISGIVGHLLLYIITPLLRYGNKGVIINDAITEEFAKHPTLLFNEQSSINGQSL